MTARARPEPSVFRAAGFFLLRTPLLPAEAAFGRQGGLLAHLSRKEVREALFLASPSLYQHAWSADGDPRITSVEELAPALHRYLARMAARPTPFGLFAGCTTGIVGDQTRLSLAPSASYRRHTQLDMHYLSELTEALGASPEVREAIPYRSNSSLYELAGGYRYIAWQPDAEMRARRYRIVAVQRDAYLDAVLRRAASGARLADLVAALIDDEIEEAEARAFLDELIDAQLLVSDLEPSLTAERPLDELATQLRGAGLGEAIEEVRGFLDRVDEEGLGVAPRRYMEAAAGLERLPCRVEIDKLFQVDLYKPAAEVTLGRDLVERIARAVALLRRIGSHSPERELEQFRERFAARYEQREVPLAEALDEEHGVGFGGNEEPSALLEGLELPAPPEALPFGERERYLLRQLGLTLAAGREEWSLSTEDIERLTAKDLPELPPAFAVMAVLSARHPRTSSDDIDRDAPIAVGDIHLQGVMGPSGARLMGRFCYGDPELRRHVEAHLRQEEALSRDAVLAEIVHLPQGRAGNVIRRPAMRAHEIPFLGRSGVSPDRQLPMSDLLVSVRGERVVLRSRRLGEEVIPCVTNAHNDRVADVGAYRFLCQVARQGCASALRFGWGPLSSAPFLPRVRKGRLLLSLATWRLTQDEMKPLAHEDPSRREQALRRLREERRLPRRLTWAQGDNQLPIDLDDPGSVRAWVSVAKSQPVVVLQEMFPAPDRHVVRGPEGDYAHEVVIPFVRDRRAVTEGSELDGAAPPRQPQVAAAGAPPRRFLVGSRWLYAKLYGGTASADHVLRELVRPLVDRHLMTQRVTSWFFLRYADPEPHLRLRFDGEEELLWSQLWPDLRRRAAALVERGVLRTLRLDSYERELERYGGAGMEPCEAIFQADSEAALSLVERLTGDEGNALRWRLALAGSDLLLDDLGLPADAKQRLMRRLREGLAREHRADAKLTHQLGKRFRRERQALERLLSPDPAPPGLLGEGLQILRARSEAVAGACRALRDLDAQGRLTEPLPNIAASLVHMHNNRLLRGQARLHEMVLYDFLGRIYDSRAARGRRPEP